MTNKRVLTYSRGSKNIELEKERKFETALPIEKLRGQTVGVSSPIKGYEKHDGILSYSIICVISGGTVRERTFLVELEKKHAFRSLAVIFRSSEEKDGGLTPKMMLHEYEKVIKDGFIYDHNRKVKIDELDAIYMFTDVDHYELELIDILKNKSNRPIWIISNPCFEIWIYYCFRNSPLHDLQELLQTNPSNRSSLLKRINGGFNKSGGFDTRKAFEHLRDGIKHSKEHYQEDKEGFPNLLSTQMHIFAEDVLVRLGEEYDKHLRKAQEFRERMKIAARK